MLGEYLRHLKSLQILRVFKRSPFSALRGPLGHRMESRLIVAFSGPPNDCQIAQRVSLIYDVFLPCYQASFAFDSLNSVSTGQLWKYSSLVRYVLMRMRTGADVVLSSRPSLQSDLPSEINLSF